MAEVVIGGRTSPARPRGLSNYFYILENVLKHGKETSQWGELDKEAITLVGIRDRYDDHRDRYGDRDPHRD